MRSLLSLQSPRLPWLIGGFLVLLLVLLAALQLRWLDQVAQAERQRVEAGVENALEEIATDLDREVSRALLLFRTPPAGADPATVAAAQLERWNRLSPVPELVEEVRVIEDDHPGHHGGAALPFPRLVPDLPGLVVPVPSDGFRFGRRAPAPTAGDGRAIQVRFDREILTRELLPSLVERHLDPVLGADAEVRVRVRRTGGEVWTTPSGPSDERARYEWSRELFGPLPADELARLAFLTGARAGALDPLDPHVAARDPVLGELTPRLRRRGALATLRDASPGWVIEVRPAAGSLEAALARARRGNLAVVSGIFILLLGAALALALAARRAQEMARRQVEFTAAVSHELRTPLAAIRSLADNLADGVVAAPEQARRYGAEIARQGERLTTMVEQVLALAAQEASLRPRTPETLDVGALVRAAAREATVTTPGIDLELEVADDLPAVLGDRTTLERAVANLVGNAVKHGAAGGGAQGWVGVRAGRGVGAGGRPEVEIVVSDRGPGIPSSERDHLFDPFFRGAGARARQLPGSGLGLHLVQRIAAAHGGRVELESVPGEGSRFSLHLPARDAGESPA